MIVLPASPGPASVRLVPVRASNDLTSPLGGVPQRVNRLGDRLRAEVTLPPMDRSDAEYWLADLMAGLSTSVAFEWPQPRGGVGTPGAPVVKGAGQAGMVLTLDGFTPGYIVRKGQLLGVQSGDRRQLLMPTAQAVANGATEMTLAFWPMLRFSPADNATIEVVQPIFQGLLGGDFGGWTLDVAETDGLTFSITEA